jgi:glycosyltransferase involved in cell wall biosynthesis
MTYSVIIPAHNEEAIIARLLDGLIGLRPQAILIVALNGCTDTTEAIVDSYLGVSKIVVSEASKSKALNFALSSAPPGPIIVVDADIEVSSTAVEQLAGVLASDRPIAGSLRARFNLRDCPALVQAFYKSFVRQPYATQKLVGLGLYGVSGEGRKLIAPLPDPLLADDLWVSSRFPPEDRVVLTGCEFIVRPPRTVRALVAVRTRIARGNRQVAARAGRQSERARRTSIDTLTWLLRDSAANPAAVPAHLTFLTINLVARVRARLISSSHWERDDSSRAGVS